MKRLRVVQAIAGVTIVGMLPLLGQATGDYSINVHVAASRIGKDCSDVTHGSSICGPIQVLQVLIDGKKYELQAATRKFTDVVALGDYKARLVSEKKKPTNEFQQEYDLQFPDKSTRKFYVIGVME